MSNLLAKWAVKYSKFSKIGNVDLDGPLSHNAMIVLLSRYCTPLISSSHIYNLCLIVLV